MNFARPNALEAPQVRWNRLGDIALCILFSLLAVSPFVRAYEAMLDSAPLLGLHFALTGGINGIMAGLFLTRKQAILGSAQWRQKIVAIVGSFNVILIGLLPVTWHPDWLLECTTVGFIIAYGWIAWSLLTLKHSFSVFPEARGLVTHGPYGLVRHPLYAAYFFTYALIMIPRISLLAVALAVIGIAAEVSRSKNEERILRATFPEYDNYAQRVRAFVPTIHRGE